MISAAQLDLSGKTYFAKALGFRVLLEAEGREMHTRTEDLSLSQDTNTANTVNFHFHIRISVRIAQVGQMGTPRRIFCVAFDNDCVFIEGISESKSGFRFLPRVQVVGLLSAEPIWKRSPHVCCELARSKSV